MLINVMGLSLYLDAMQGFQKNVTEAYFINLIKSSKPSKKQTRQESKVPTRCLYFSF